MWVVLGQSTVTEKTQVSVVESNPASQITRTLTSQPLGQHLQPEHTSTPMDQQAT